MPYNQKDLPLIFDLAGPGFFSLGSFSVPLPFILGSPAGVILRPERFDLQRPARGAVINTAGSAFLDDFGRGAPYLMLEGHTGWGMTPLSGIWSLKMLEAIFVEYLERRKRVAAAGGDPDTVLLLYFDTLNLQAFALYPQEFVMLKSKRNPLLYYYRMRFTVLVDLLYDTLYGEIPDWLDFGGFGGLTGGLKELGGLFGGLFA